MSELLEGLISSSGENIFGGQDFFDSSGASAGHSSDNIFGGEDFFDEAGNRVGHSADNILGGEDVFDASGQQVMTTRAGLDGLDVFGDDGQQIGRASAFGDSVSLHDMSGHHATWHANLFGGLTADPLQNLGALEFPSFR